MLLEFFNRLTVAPPIFFKKLIKVGVAIGAAGTVIVGLPSALETAGIHFVMPHVLEVASSYMICIGSVITILSKLPNEFSAAEKDAISKINADTDVPETEVKP